MSVLAAQVIAAMREQAPKAVRATQGRFAMLAHSMGFTADDVLYCPMPLFHGNALVSNLLPGIASGATVALRDKFSASAFLADVRRFGAGVWHVGQVGRDLLAART